MNISPRLLQKLFGLLNRLFINDALGKKEFQPFFEFMHAHALKGMNYDSNTFENNGEAFVLNYISKKFTFKPVIFDVGANIGQYIDELNEFYDFNNVAIYSFEPSEVIFKKLQESVNHKNYANVKLYNIGFGETESTLQLFKNTEFSAMASVYNRRLDHFNIDMSEVEEIKILTLDEFCQSEGIESIDFLKIDTEGHELSVFKGAKNMLANKRIKTIQFEFGGCNIDSRTYFQDFWYMLKDNYNLFRLTKNGLHPINSYQETLEIFTNINFFAELK